jgi:CRP/FNR family cyclic AMP-dependent transcriptional regulator
MKKTARRRDERTIAARNARPHNLSPDDEAGGDPGRSFQRHTTEARDAMTNLLAPLFPHLEDLGGASGFVEEIQEILKTLSLFEGFNRQESALLCDYMECFGAPSRSTILREAEHGDFLILILTGRISVVKEHAPGHSKVIAEVGPGGFLGEMALFDNQPRFASCITSEPTDFAVLTRDGLNDILIDHPRLGNKLLLTLLQLMTQRLRDAVTLLLPTLVGSVI